MTRRAAMVVPALLLAAAGCSRKPSGGTADSRATATVTPHASSAIAPLPEAASASIDATARLDDCALGHRGVLLDLGDPTTRAVVGGATDEGRGGRLDAVEHDGETWARIQARSVTLTFDATAVALASDPSAPDAVPVLEARIRGGSARSVSVYLNGRAAGYWTLAKGEERIAQLKLALAGTPNGAQLVAGTNELVLRFNGSRVRGGATPDAQAEVAWIHLGSPDPDGAYGAPTRGDALTSVTIGGVAKRALSLRAPGYARCAGFLPNGGAVTASLGLAGGASAEAEIRVVRDRAAPFVLGTYALTAADAGAWKSVTLPLPDLGIKGAGTLGALELVVTRGARGARVLFGAPKVVARAPAAPIAPPPLAASGVRGVLLVVLGDVARATIEPYGGKIAMPELTALAHGGVTFDAHRASSGLASGAFASMITGLPARAHGVLDAEAALPVDVTTLADAVRQAGIAAALFTANPTTSAAFGFDRGWGTFDAKSPTEDAASLGVFDAAAHWLDAHKDDRFLAVVHARGGHPPWDATTDDLKALPPQDYVGGLDPKHAGELLAKARRTPPQIRLTDADRARAWALYALSLGAHDAAIGRLVAALRAAGREKDTLVIVTGDASMDELSHVPFGDSDALDEGTLAVPLVVRPPPPSPGEPASPLAGHHVTTPTAGVDVARTILDALGLAPPTAFQGSDLWDTAAGATDPRGRPELAASNAHYALRWGGFVLTGVRAPSADRERGDHEKKLCDLTLEPACLSDVRGAFPVALEALHREAFDRLAPPPHPRVPAVIDAHTASALRAWGLEPRLRTSAQR